MDGLAHPSVVCFTATMVSVYSDKNHRLFRAVKEISPLAVTKLLAGRATGSYIFDACSVSAATGSLASYERQRVALPVSSSRAQAREGIVGAAATRTPACVCGVFFVTRRNGTLRLIVGAPPPTSLVTGQGFSRVELQGSWASLSCPVTDDIKLDFLGCEAHWQVSAGDVEQAFHNVISPVWIRKLFALCT